MIEDFGLPAIDAGLIASDRELADLFEQTTKMRLGEDVRESDFRRIRAVFNWVINEVKPRHEDGLPLPSSTNLAVLIEIVEEKGEVTRDQGREILKVSMATGRHPQEIARELGLAQEHDPLRLGPIIDEVIAENRKAWEDYLAGNDRVVGFLVAKVRDKTGQTAKAALVNTLLREKRDEVAHQH